MELFAIPHDGTVRGDNTFWCEAIPLKSLNGKLSREAVKRHIAVVEWGCDPEEVEGLKGVWIVTKRVNDLIVSIDVDSGHDSIAYAINHARKKAYKEHALFEVEF